MSTKAIRALIEDAGNWDDSKRHELMEAALAEVEAVERACIALQETYHEGTPVVWALVQRVAEEAS